MSHNAAEPRGRLDAKALETRIGEFTFKNGLWLTFQSVPTRGRLARMRRAGARPLISVS